MVMLLGRMGFESPPACKLNDDRAVLNTGSCDNWQSDGLENRCPEMDSGFESLTPRQM